VKITPAHDPNDFLVGQRHGLESVQVIDENGMMSQSSGSAFAGLDRFEARNKMVDLLKKEELLEKIEEHQHAVGHCYRCDTMIEPYLSEQWFVKTGPLAKESIQAVSDKRIQIIPEQWETTYFQWMENIRDWCISRQLWWGHRIPAWTCSSCGHVTVSETDPQVCEKCNSPDIIQDEDVLDTWFSSALWPFSTMGWPEKTRELEVFYPTGLLTTGFDILFFWVARMIMMGLRFMGEVPFRDVYIHALVRDENGQKMSKSRGNVIDPLDIIEQYGADSLRMALAALTVQGRDIFLSTQRIETYRLFMNKIWNASRFALMHIGGDNRAPVDLSGASLRMHDTWMLKRLADVSREVTERLDGYFYGEAARTLYEFFWNELCDWYLEMVKPALYGEEGEDRKQASRKVVSIVFRDTLKLLHPFIPFVTEELWLAFGFGQPDVSIERSSWPGAASPAGADDAAENMASLQEIVRGLRNLRAEAGIHPQKMAPRAFIVVNGRKRMDSVMQQEDMISLLSRVEEILFLEEAAPRPAQTLTAVFGEGEIFLEFDGILNVTEELERLAAEKLKVQKNVAASRRKLENDKFISRAPAEVVEKERTRLSEMEERIQMISRNMESLKRE
ncbi:MAG: valine--tRNA ligase, partial [Synergistota bacterium]|nr:valine--tRNA ligase [Synergistota bacterium]